MAGDIERTEAGVQADLGSVPPAQAVAALVAAGVAVSSAAPRNRLEDVFLAMVDASGAAGSSSDHPTAGAGPGPSAPPPDTGRRTPVGSQQGGSA
jgi:ABC-2 type transport system ATP-binding protein